MRKRSFETLVDGSLSLASRQIGSMQTTKRRATMKRTIWISSVIWLSISFLAIGKAQSQEKGQQPEQKQSQELYIMGLVMGVDYDPAKAAITSFNDRDGDS